ncbi:hypothetical protein QE401_002584 [Pseudoroseomonas cervicalis]|nr:hypothetical protein [Pseudoroseomonas cervicalis]
MRHAGLPDTALLPLHAVLPRPAPARPAPAEQPRDIARPGRNQADPDQASWDQVWADYDAGQAPAAPRPAAPATARRPRRARLALALLAVLAGAGLCAAALTPVTAAVQLAGMLLRQDVAPLLAQLDQAAPRAPQAAPALPALGGTADAYLAMLSGEMQRGWQDAAALRQAVAVRRQAAPGLSDAVLRPVARWEGWQMTGWSSLRLALAPQPAMAGQPAGAGLGLELAWQDGAWRVTTVSLGLAAATPGHPARSAGTQLARSGAASGRQG